MNRLGTALVTAGVLAATTLAAHAFCGFYVAGSDQKMFNDATQVVLMREGTRTVLSMQNDYRGPIEDFAMVIPVPVVLKPTDVKVLDKGVFQRIDSLGSPRLVEYWEQDPCPPPVEEYQRPMKMARPEMSRMAPKAMAPMEMSEGGGGAVYDAPKRDTRRAVPPVLASFSANPTTVTADTASPVMFTWTYANEPYPTPQCTIDHGVGALYSGQTGNVLMSQSGDVVLRCANQAGKSEKKIRINTVKIEAKFDVAEYQILILSAAEAAGLEEWLKINNYKIPADAQALLRPYIEAGEKFFVAKVNPKKVAFIDGHAALSPLRFSYDSEEFSLPIRLGMANSSGKQDLIINILSSNKRYEVSNYKNVFIPTNFDVKPSVKTRFGEFYAALFDKTIEANPGSVVTEYAWTAVPNYHCDPCTSADINNPDLMALGADVTGGPMAAGNFVLTRLHARYGKSDMKDDLRFKDATPVTGGREQWSKQGLEYGAAPSAQNYFQARFAIRHWWTGPIKCKIPQRGIWGGPPDGNYSPTLAAGRTAFAPRGKLALNTVIGRDLWEIGYKKAAPAPKPGAAPGGGKPMGFLFFGSGALLGLAYVLWRRGRARA